jgi:N-acetylneuraminic acid mutarotase
MVAFSTLVAASPLAAAHNTWSAGKPMPTALFSAAAAVLNGKIYVIGGTDGSGNTNIVQVYDPVAKTWSAGVPLPAALGGASAVTIGTTLYVFGGNGLSGLSGAVYSLAAGGTAWQTLASMPTPRADTAAAAVGKTIYVIGGNSAATPRSPTVEAYNTVRNKWVAEPSLLVGKSEISAGTIAGTVYAAGGYTLNEDTGDNESLKAGAKTWTALAAEPDQTNQACTGVVAGKLYMLGGAHDHPAVSSATAYDPATTSWSTLLAMPTAAAYAAGAVYKGKIYCFGGSNFDTGGTFYNLTQIYTP